MPSYQYRCSPCNYSETRFNVRIERADKQKCERCHALMARMTSEANFVLKGPGFHQNDYAKGRPRDSD